jgi:hypothetical protein
METNADWSPYDGWQLAGFARTTLSRGDVIVDDYKVVGTEGRGRWLPRTTAGLAAARSRAKGTRQSQPWHAHTASDVDRELVVVNAS